MIEPRRATLLIAMLGVLGGTRSLTAANSPELIQKNSRQMGTEFRISVYACDKLAAEKAIELAFQRIRELDLCLSNYKSESDVNRFCRTAPHEQPQALHPDLYAVLLKSQQVSVATDGAFDVTLGPLTRLWRRARKFRYPVDEASLQAARQLTGYSRLELSEVEAQGRLRARGMKIDLGGIAKGYALDAALAVLNEAGCQSALVDGGGDLAIGNPPPGGNGWRVALPGLEKDAPPTGYLILKNTAIATSGDLWQYLVIDGKRYSHLIDPRSGRPVPGRHNATVIANTAVEADAWASALLVLGPQQGLERLRKQDAPMAARVLTWGDDKIQERRSETFPVEKALP